MREETKKAILDHAEKEYPRESCGLILNLDGVESYFPCRNLAKNQRDFIMDPSDYARAEDAGQIIAVAHSHPDGPVRPSEADKVACEASGLPWVIFSYPGGAWFEFQPSGYRAPLKGRPFVHGVLDCYSLIRDWFKETRCVDLPDFDRREEWWTKGENLYIDNFESAGFKRIDAKDLAPGDCILMRIFSKVVNHAAVYLGHDRMLHHVQKRLSCEAVYDGYWKKNTAFIVRYEGGKS